MDEQNVLESGTTYSRKFEKNRRKLETSHVGIVVVIELLWYTALILCFIYARNVMIGIRGFGSASVFLALVVVQAVLMIATLWRLFEKADVRGWKILIPIYNIYALFQVMDVTGLPIVLLNFLGWVLMIVLGRYGGIGVAAAWLINICSAVTGIAMLHRLVRRFGHSGFFTAGMILLAPLAPLFLLILGWDGNLAEPVDREAKQMGRRAAVLLLVIYYAVVLYMAWPVLRNGYNNLMGHTSRNVQSGFQTADFDLSARMNLGDDYQNVYQQLEQRFAGMMESVRSSGADSSSSDRGDIAPVPGSTRTVCPICNGSGVQHIQNMICDVNMGWYDAGYDAACGGCGGSGYIG